jgi:signal transduction histidine kinase
MDPGVIMDEILLLYSRKLESRHIGVTRRYRSYYPVDGYSGELRQLLANLLVNAVDAMEDGGTLQVGVTAARNWSDGREGVRITVADNGSGIPPEDLAQIFEPFYTTKQETGTGLGLWVSRGIVQKHGGSIRVRSRAEERGNGPTNGNRAARATGTVFWIFLPQRHGITRVA